jgi:hypothetical protein
MRNRAARTVETPAVPAPVSFARIDMSAKLPAEMTTRVVPRGSMVKVGWIRGGSRRSRSRGTGTDYQLRSSRRLSSPKRREARPKTIGVMMREARMIMDGMIEHVFPLR